MGKRPSRKMAVWDMNLILVLLESHWDNPLWSAFQFFISHVDFFVEHFEIHVLWLYKTKQNAFKEQILPKIFCCPKTTWDEKLLNNESFRNFRTPRFILRKLELKKLSTFQNSTFLRIHQSPSYFQHFLLRTRPTDQNKACLPFISLMRSSV